MVRHVVGHHLVVRGPEYPLLESQVTLQLRQRVHPSDGRSHLLLGVRSRDGAGSARHPLAPQPQFRVRKRDDVLLPPDGEREPGGEVLVEVAEYGAHQTYT
ncbi:hypothetical protein Pa4123_26180 [Phytohabitans aurantiacus]|uniref:Uncharacterized protein n=1 Tax=Phytohabitans aurantiacus TaxID=3016789 RepID=A0ABQ5QRU4_9ACTN|nr:hypothetical protein Pa4123_26180 [Phytohabitans aurantiacus]